MFKSVVISESQSYITAISQCFKWVYLLFQEGKSKDKTRDEITAMISQHVKALNKIYGSETFTGKYKHRNIRFEVQRIKVSTVPGFGYTMLMY